MLRILNAIGDTPLAALRPIVPGISARLLTRLELANPASSMKDGMRRMIVQPAAASGQARSGHHSR